MIKNKTKEVKQMAWRPTTFLQEAELDNTEPGKVTGWVRLSGMDRKLILDLEGDFEKEIRGSRIRIVSKGRQEREAPMFLQGMTTRQTGRVGCIKLISSWHPGRKYLYIEWYSRQNGRVVIEFETSQVSQIGTGVLLAKQDGNGTDGRGPIIVCVKPSTDEAEAGDDQGQQGLHMAS